MTRWQGRTIRVVADWWRSLDTTDTTLRLSAIAIAASSLTWLFLSRTDPERIVEAASQPYAVIEVVPESLQQVPIRIGPDDVQWALQYSNRVLRKDRSCDSLLIERRIDRLGGSVPVALNAVPSQELAPVTDTPVVVAGGQILLDRRLAAGDYVLTVTVHCFVRGTDGKAAPLVPPAKTEPLCFRMGTHDDERRPLSPTLSKLCAEQLSGVVLDGGGNLARAASVPLR